MAKPTYTVSIVGKEKANAAFKRSGKTQEFIAGTSSTTRQLVSKFLKGLSVEQPKFIAICEALELKWQEIAELQESEATGDSNLPELEILVQEVKQKIADVVIERCWTMRVLDMTQSVDLDQIYTDVNILEKVSNKDRVKPNEVLPNCNREDVDRWMMGKIKEHIAGLEAVETHKKLMVLGKPGSGKTTFLKYLAISCLNGKFHSELVPIFVTLRTYSEAKDSPSLEEYILDELQHCKVTKEVAELLLDNGKTLILLDGLDEVKDEHDERVRQDIAAFSIRRLKNRFAITCRIAARGYVFERFTDVEVADFDDKQIETFINRWFLGKDETNAEILLEKLQNNQPVKELAKTPLLLTLICFLFESCKDLPTKRSDLYKDGLVALMKTWDADRKIEREQIYIQKLSLQSKQDMLGQIALRGFENGEYFFQKEDLQRQIECICNLTNSDDSEVMLKAIEYHHGLLMERAKNIYSFSHLTFQEYFTALEIDRKKHFEILVQNISNPRWKEVFYLTSEMLRRSDNFFKLMKEHIDGILTDDKKLQAFLEWADQKTNSVQFGYKCVAVRAFYAYVEAFNHDLGRFLDKALYIGRFLDHNLSRILNHVFTNTIVLTLDLNPAIDLAIASAFTVAVNLAYVPNSAVANDLDLVLILASNLGDDMLIQALQALKSQLLTDPKNFYQWWENYGEEWRNGLRQVCIKHRNICHDWQFTKEQIKLLNQYYEANLLLVECMNRSDVSEQVCEEIESTLLLPISSIPNTEL